MKQYDFDRLIDRHDTCSVKTDFVPGADVLPLWIADMDFPVADEIVAAIEPRYLQGVAHARRGQEGAGEPGGEGERGVGARGRAGSWLRAQRRCAVTVTSSRSW